MRAKSMRKRVKQARNSIDHSVGSMITLLYASTDLYPGNLPISNKLTYVPDNYTVRIYPNMWV